MAEQIFREKSLKKISSPEELNDYVKVANPGVWLLLVSVIALLIGFFAWGAIGQIETKIDATCLSEDGKLKIYVKEDDMSEITLNTELTVDGVDYKITSISNSPIQVDSLFNAYMIHVGNLTEGEWVYVLNADSNLKTGVYKAKVVKEKIKPLSLIFD